MQLQQQFVCKWLNCSEPVHWVILDIPIIKTTDLDVPIIKTTDGKNKYSFVCEKHKASMEKRYFEESVDRYWTTYYIKIQ